MDKKNLIPEKKISKWEAAPDSFRKLVDAFNGLCDQLSIYPMVNDEVVIDTTAKTLTITSEIGVDMANELDVVMKSLAEISKYLKLVLDDYNELEAKHQKECGMISEYEQQNKELEKNLRADNAVLKYKVKMLKTRLNQIWGIHSSALEDLNGRINTLTEEKEKLIKEKQADRSTFLKDSIAQGGRIAAYLCENEQLKAKIERLESLGIHTVANEELEDTTEHCQLGRYPWGPKKNPLDEQIGILNGIIHDHNKEKKRLEAKVKELEESILNRPCKKCKENYVNEIKVRCRELEDKDKMIAEMDAKQVELKLENLNLRTDLDGLRTALEKNGIVADKWNNSNGPQQWVIHVIELQKHKDYCDILEKRVDTLIKENKNLRRTLKFCEKDAINAKNLCDGIRFNAERVRNQSIRPACFLDIGDDT